MAESLRLGTSSKKLDAVAIQQGVWKECPFRPGFSVQILPAATYNPRFRKAVQNQAMKAASKFKSQRDGDVDAIEGEAQAEFLSRYEDPAFIASALVADVGGLYNENGNEVKYTSERGEAIFGDPGNADVREWVVNEALTYGQFYAKDVEEEAKNSQTGSGGKKAGAGKSEKTKS